MIYIIRTARLPKVKSDPRILNVRNLLKVLSIKIISILSILYQYYQPNSIWLRWKTLFVDLLRKHPPVGTIRIKIT